MFFWLPSRPDELLTVTSILFVVSHGDFCSADVSVVVTHPPSWTYALMCPISSGLYSAFFFFIFAALHDTAFCFVWSRRGGGRSGEEFQ